MEDLGNVLAVLAGLFLVGYLFMALGIGLTWPLWISV